MRAASAIWRGKISPIRSGQPAIARDLSLRTLGRFFELSLALSAWKEIPGHRWALRINPSSGNLHPTEAYALLPAMEGLGFRGGAYHYLSRDHALELRSGWNCSETMNVKAGFYVAFTSVLWRESWKYGERAFRYCQHDLGHALAAVRFSAATLGWTAQLQIVAPEYLVWLLGLEPRFPRPSSGFRRLQRRPRLHCLRLNLRWSGSANPICLALDISPGL